MFKEYAIYKNLMKIYYKYVKIMQWRCDRGNLRRRLFPNNYNIGKKICLNFFKLFSKFENILEFLYN